MPTITCPHCSRVGQVSAYFNGRRVACRNCKTKFVVDVGDQQATDILNELDDGKTPVWAPPTPEPSANPNLGPANQTAGIHGPRVPAPDVPTTRIPSRQRRWHWVGVGAAILLFVVATVVWVRNERMERDAILREVENRNKESLRLANEERRKAEALVLLEAKKEQDKRDAQERAAKLAYEAAEADRKKLEALVASLKKDSEEISRSMKEEKEERERIARSLPVPPTKEELEEADRMVRDVLSQKAQKRLDEYCVFMQYKADSVYVSHAIDAIKRIHYDYLVGKLDSSAHILKGRLAYDTADSEIMHYARRIIEIGGDFEMCLDADNKKKRH